MQELMVRNNFKSSSKIGLSGSIITWSLNYKTWDFKVHTLSDDRKFNELSYIKLFEDFLECFEGKERLRFEHHLERIYQGKKVKSIRTLFSFDGNEILYCTMSAYKKSSDIIFGNMILQFKLPKNNEFSTLFLRIFDNQHHGMILTDKNSNIVACNEKLEKSTGYDLEELIGKNTRIFNSGKLDTTFYVGMWASIHYDGHWIGNVISKRKDGINIPQYLTIQALKFSEHSTYYLGITRQLSEDSLAFSQEIVGGIDLFTQLPCEGSFLIKLDNIIKKSKSDESTFVVIIDPKLKGKEEFEFKVQMSKAFNCSNNTYLCGYLGGSRFVISIKFDAETERINKVIPKKHFNDLIIYLRNYVSNKNIIFVTRNNIGVSVLGVDATNSEQLIKHAVSSLEEDHYIKNTRVCVFDREAHSRHVKRNELKKIAKKAILTKSVEVFYQPIIDIKEWKVIKFEALSRFRDKNGAILNTDEIISTIEELGYINELDLIVAERALVERVTLAEKYGDNIGISINVSLNEKKSKTCILDRLHSLLVDFKINKSFITVEVTESAYFDTSENQSYPFDKLESDGVLVAIDDFGTGYSSFTYLMEPTFDILKIDKSFVTNIKEKSRNYHIVKMIVNLAHKLDIQIIAEGVESLEDAIILHGIGVDMLQGYYFSKPMPLNSLGAINKNINDVKNSVEQKQNFKLVTKPPIVRTNTSLLEIKKIFDSNLYQSIPVVSSGRCVGVIDKSTYNLHILPSIGTDLETTKDISMLNKKAIQIMDVSIEVVTSSIVTTDIIYGIEQNKKFPWVVVNDNGKYSGIIEKDSVLKVLTSI